MYYIYLITNKVNDKTYIGQRKCPANKFPEQDIGYMGSGKIILQSREKYGIENFSKEILAVAETQENIDILERVFIALYRQAGKAEYNIANGGSGGNGSSNKGKIRTEETKEKLRQLNLGKQLSEETKRKISESVSACGRIYVVSEETRIKMSLAHKGQKRSLDSIKKQVRTQTGRQLSEETKRKISESNKGVKHKPLSEEAKKRISIRMKGKRNPFYGKQHSEETKRKISENQKGAKNHNFGKHFSEETRRKMSLSMTGIKHIRKEK